MTRADPPSSVGARLRAAAKHHRAGQFEAAAALYAEILETDDGHPDALHLSGVLAHQQGRSGEAIEKITRAIDRAPALPEFRLSRGVVYRAIGDLAAAAADFAQAVALNPRYLEGWVNLGVTRLQQDDPHAALAAFERAAALAPGAAEVQAYLGTGQLRTGALDAAIATLTRAVALDPKFAEAHYNLGVAHERRGNAAAAERAWRRAIQENPFYLKPWNNLGLLLHRQGRRAEARAGFERALMHGPAGHTTAELWNNLANLLDESNEVSAALAAYERAVALAPADARFQLNFGVALLTVGQVERAAAHVAKARELDPSDPLAAQCAVMGQLFLGDDPQPALAAAREWAASLAVPQPAPHANSRDPDRRLRIGYVSPDFFHHAVANFIAPVLAAHDAEAVDVFCYAEVKTPDPITERFRRLVSPERWRDTTGMSDETLAATVRGDGIDILIDLAGHTVGSRLRAFARKPAPIQATWIGYPATTGLPQIDWRISDALADPPGLTESQYTERLLRLPAGFICYRPVADAPAVTALPADANGHVTFGCFNHGAKIGERTLDVWADLLKAVPDARLCLKHRGLSVPSIVAEYRQAFERRGLAPSRLDLLGFVDDPQGHLAAYGRIDVALDPFPYNGTTTTCEALWMGVPVVTLAGSTHMSRVGVSLLTRAGLPELVADSPAAYIDAAAQLAADRERLRALRQTLRARMAASDLCHAERVTRDLEAALRSVWRTWCGGSS